MAYILTEQMMAEDGPGVALERYRAYLRGVQDRLPAGVYELASSDWYHDFSAHRSPHDAWLEKFVVEEVGSGARSATRSVAITIRLLGAYHDGHIEFHYAGVRSYRCELIPDQQGGHGDWRYDEFRLAPSGNVVHEIEWWQQNRTGTWLIEAKTVECRWLPSAPSSPSL